MSGGFAKKRNQGHRSHVNGTRRFMKVKRFREMLEIDAQRLTSKYVAPKRKEV